MRYRVRYVMDDNYAVYDEQDDMFGDCNCFIGSLSDCESYIRLKEQGYM